jgi:hypothetical protein
VKQLSRITWISKNSGVIRQYDYNPLLRTAEEQLMKRKKKFQLKTNEVRHLCRGKM